MHAESSPSPTLIQSLQRGMRLVETVTQLGPLTARELSARTGIVLPTTYHLVRTLVHEGYLQRLADGSYALGAQMESVTQLEARARSVRLIREGVAELAAEARVTVSVGEFRDGEIVVTQFVTHPCTPKIECWRGMAIPGHATAIGKNILARLPVEHRADYLAAHPLNALTSHTITTGARLDRDLESGGLSRSDLEYSYGISCVAAPLINTGRYMALGAAFSWSRPQRSREQIESAVCEAAARISDVFGIGSASSVHR